MRRNQMRPIHPGEILREEFLVPARLSARELARRLRVPTSRVTRVLAGRSPVTTETSLRLARLLRTSAEFWLNLQTAHDLRRAEREVGSAIDRDIEPMRSRE